MTGEAQVRQDVRLTHAQMLNFLPSVAQLQAWAQTLQAAFAPSVLPLFYPLAACSWSNFLLLPGENGYCACSSL